MGLKTSGILSGIGDGLGRGLQQMQQGIMQFGLNEQRDEMENRRLQLTFEQNKGLLGLKEAADTARHQETLAANAANTDKQIASTRDIEGLRSSDRRADMADTKDYRNADLGLKKDELGLKRGALGTENILNDRKLSNEEKKTKIEEQLNNAKAEYYKSLANLKDRSPGTGAGGSGSSPEAKHADKYIDHIVTEQIKGLNDLLKLAETPEERDDILGRIAVLDDRAAGVAGIQKPTPAPSRGLTIPQTFPRIGAKQP